MAIIANKTVVLSNKKLDTIEPQSKQKEIKARIEPDEKGFLVRKPSQFMHDMLNEQNKQE